jgi:hypothetical protein
MGWGDGGGELRPNQLPKHGGASRFRKLYLERDSGDKTRTRQQEKQQPNYCDVMVHFVNGHVDSHLVLIVNCNSLSIWFLDQFFHQSFGWQHLEEICRRVRCWDTESFAACFCLA